MSHPVHKPVIVALDFPTADAALALAQQLDPNECRVKVGKELFTRAGPQLVEKLIAQDFDVFLDLKFHDIPNTVAAACHAAADMGVWMLNVHGLGGLRMMMAARDGIERSSHRPLLIAVTILTSMQSADLVGVGLYSSPKDNVRRLAKLANKAELDGVVCSPEETEILKAELGDKFILVTPGIRPAGSVRHDQQRITTPEQAIAQGSHYLVIGRPITEAPEPMAALEAIQTRLIVNPT